ncbi:unnamed protein product [Blepharisma stoltei]|uniref:Uncharacterized protein n=1 Tax=Blepharisma stoltei TaxID=1481888 RepID=A0AAU9J9J4_9CILI|nr:unnamed protein product [Blepharisma stoltei]
MYKKESSKSAEKSKISVSRITLPPKPSFSKDYEPQSCKNCFEKSSSNLNSAIHPVSPLVTSSGFSSSQYNTPRNSSQILNKFTMYTNSVCHSRLNSEDLSTSSDGEFQEARESIKKLENENLRLKIELVHNKEQLNKLREKVEDLRKEAREKDSKIAHVNMLLKESEKKFLSLKGIQNLEQFSDKDEQIKDLEYKLNLQKNELTERFLKEKQELEIKIIELDMLYREKNKNEIQTITNNYLEEQNKELKNIEAKCSILEKENQELKSASESSSIQRVAKLSSQIEAEITQLNHVFEMMVSDRRVSLAMLIIAAQARINMSPSPITTISSLENSLKELSHMRTAMSDLYAEKCGNACKIQ